VGLALAGIEFTGQSSGIETIEGSTAGAAVYGGYRFGPHWAVEGTWEFIDEVEQTGEGELVSEGPFRARCSATMDALSIRALRFFPFAWGSLYAGLGAGSGDFEEVIEIEFPQQHESASFMRQSSGEGWSVLGGAHWDLSAISLRLELEQLRFDGIDGLLQDESKLVAVGIRAHRRF
jgi:hypothetical protein